MGKPIMVDDDVYNNLEIFLKKEGIKHKFPSMKFFTDNAILEKLKKEEGEVNDGDTKEENTT